MNNPNPQEFPAFKSSSRLLARFLSLLVRGCLWMADRLAYAVMVLEAKGA